MFLQQLIKTMAMKQILCILILLNTTILVAQEKEKGFVDKILYEEALKALENQSFIIRMDTYEWGSGRTLLDNRTNFIKLEKGVVSSKYDDGRADSEPWTGVTHLAKIRTCRAADIEINHDENISVIIPIDYSNDIEGADKAKIVLEKGTNKCVVHFYDKNREFGYSKGKLYSIGATIVY